MSLFGTSPDALPARPKSSLFDDDAAPASKTNSSLFADESDTGAASPWDLPTLKKSARGNVVKTLLKPDEVPESYVDAYDGLLHSGEGQAGGSVSVAGVKRLLSGSGISGGDQATISQIVGADASGGIGRGEFNVLLALIGLAQEGEELSLDSVDERRRNLPTPTLPSSKPKTPTKAESASPATPAPQTTSGASASQSRDPRKQSFGFTETDPWASPNVHRGHDHAVENGAAQYPKSANGASSGAPQHTTSSFTTAPVKSVSRTPPVHQAAERPAPAPGWDSFISAQDEGFSGAGEADEGFGSGPGDDAGGTGGSSGARRALGAARIPGGGVEEVIVVNVLEEKEGIFLFQHRNYEVASVRRNSKVIRRYSDFVWLLDCLHKRYPFRQLPLLPPKRVAINGNHIAADALFIEKRRRGLARFANALVRHPVLNQEQLVIMFLTVPTELAVWRKQATISVQEEFTGKSLPRDLEDSLPSTLQDTFDTVRSGVRRSAEIYIGLCNMIERLTRAKGAIAIESSRFALALNNLTEVSSDAYNIDTNDVPLLNEGLKSTAKHLSQSQSLLEDEARAWDEGVLEDLKRQRDCL
ncbi:Sorting nexin mvp1, partial [Elasticomyces elasticus]